MLKFNGNIILSETSLFHYFYRFCYKIVFPYGFIFTRMYEISELKPLKMGIVSLKLSKEGADTSVLDVILDSKISWVHNAENSLMKALCAFYARKRIFCRRCTWMNTSVIRLILTPWNTCLLNTKVHLSSVQRLASLTVTGSMWSTLI